MPEYSLLRNEITLWLGAMHRGIHSIVRPLLVAAVLGLTHPAAHAAEGIVLRFFFTANYLDSEMWRQCCEGFEKENPGITIRREWFPGLDYDRKLQLVLITNRAADILFMDSKPYPGYLVRGYLEDLRPYVNRESDPLERDLAAELRWLDAPPEKRDPAYRRKFMPTALESFTYKGTQCGMPWDGNTQVIFYNKDMFDQARIPYPEKDWTWDDFRATAKKLTVDDDGDGIPDRYGANLDFHFLPIAPLFWSFGADFISADQTHSTIQESNALEAGQFIYNVREVDRSTPFIGQLDTMSGETQLLTGRVGMVLGATYMIPNMNQIPTDEGMRWGAVELPKGPRGGRVSRATWDGVSINANISQEKKEAAWKFIKYVMSEQFQSLVGGIPRGVPVRPEYAEKYYATPERGAPARIAVDSFAFSRLMPITPSLPRSAASHHR